MPVFTYKAMDQMGASVNGTIIADTAVQARESLRDQGMAIQHVTAKRSSINGSALLQSLAIFRGNKRGLRSEADLISMIRELSTLLGVGIPLLEALDTLTRQHTGQIQSVIMLLRDRVSSGESLATAMREQDDIFDDLSISMVEVGENAGTLETVLDRLATFKERWQRLKGRISTALMYPIFVIFIGMLVSVFLMTYVVPQVLAPILEGGHAVPWATKVVMAMSNLLTGWWWLLLIVALIVVGSINAVLRSKRGRYAWHRTVLRLPLIGKLVQKQEVMRIAVVMSTLIRSGVTFIRSIQIAQRTSTNLVVRDALGRCETAVQAGREIADALEATGAFPPMVVQIFSVGQQSGRLEEMLDRLASDYDQQVQSSAQRLTTILEPILILILAFFVGLIVFAVMLPILEVGDVI